MNPAKILSLVLIIAMIASCQRELHFDPVPEQDHNLVIKFIPVVQYDTNNLVYGDTYSNFFGQDYKVSAFKFYLHNIQMINTDSSRVFETGKTKHFLVDFNDSASTEIRIAILPYKYNRIAFTLGVDSALNVSGAQTDALDPAKGMFWTWSTGYIMAKLEGTAPASNQPSHAFEYHIGGFEGPDKVIRKVNLLFPFAQHIDLLPGKTTTVTITADVNDWFNNPHDIRFDVNPVVTMPGTLARQVSENYSKMFTVTKIVNEP